MHGYYVQLGLGLRVRVRVRNEYYILYMYMYLFTRVFVKSLHLEPDILSKARLIRVTVVAIISS